MRFGSLVFANGVNPHHLMDTPIPENFMGGEWDGVIKPLLA